MSFATAISIVSVAAAAVGVLAGLRQATEGIQRLRALGAIEAEDKHHVVDLLDPRALDNYLFNTLGAMTVREYARDANARQLVARAVGRVDDLLSAREPNGQGGGVFYVHLRQAERALDRGDTVGALARLRLAIELSLRDLALVVGMPAAERATGGRLIEMLVRRQLLNPNLASGLLDATKIANKAIHGGDLDLEEAHRAFALTHDALASVDRRAHPEDEDG